MHANTVQRQLPGVEACFPNEGSMVRELRALLTNQTGPVCCSSVVSEFDYSSGRTDLIGLSSRAILHAFEAKLLKWREALEQARRNACFAHYTYVALPPRAAERALKAKDDFRRHGVGLLVLTGNEARLAIRPRKNVPLLPWLTKVALAHLSLDPTPPQ